MLCGADARASRSSNAHPRCVCCPVADRARCADNQLNDEPPCTNYADPMPRRAARFPVDSLPNITSSPVELFQTASGLPLLLTLAVLLLHIWAAACCRPRAGPMPTAVMRRGWRRTVALRADGHRADRAPLIGPGTRDEVHLVYTLRGVLLVGVLSVSADSRAAGSKSFASPLLTNARS